MSARRYEPDIFSQSLVAIPLGLIDSAGDITFGARPGGTLGGIVLDPDYRTFIEGLDLEQDLRERSVDDQALLWWMGNAGMLALVRRDDPDGVLDLVPVVRRGMRIDEESDDGYRIGLDGGGSFDVTELGARFLPHMDGTTTLQRIASRVREEALADPEDRALVRAAETAEGVSFEHKLAETALETVIAMRASGAATFERLT